MCDVDEVTVEQDCTLVWSTNRRPCDGMENFFSATREPGVTAHELLSFPTIETVDPSERDPQCSRPPGHRERQAHTRWCQPRVTTRVSQVAHETEKRPPWAPVQSPVERPIANNDGILSYRPADLSPRGRPWLDRALEQTPHGILASELYTAITSQREFGNPMGPAKLQQPAHKLLVRTPTCDSTIHR